MTTPDNTPIDPKDLYDPKKTLEFVVDIESRERINHPVQGQKGLRTMEKDGSPAEEEVFFDIQFGWLSSENCFNFRQKYPRVAP